MTTYYHGDMLCHHGVKGQKWGVRRYQNDDGSYKSGAEGRYNSTVQRIKSAVSTAKQTYNTVKETKNKIVTKLNDPKFQKAVKIGAAVAATAVVAYGAYKISNSRVKQSAKTGKATTESILDKYYNARMKSIKINSDIRRQKLINKKRYENLKYDVNELSKLINATSRKGKSGNYEKQLADLEEMITKGTAKEAFIRSELEKTRKMIYNR